MTKSIRERIQLSEELRLNSKLPWAPVLLRCVESNTMPDLVVQASPDKEYAPYTLFRTAFVLAEFGAASDMSRIPCDIFPEAFVRNMVFTYRNYYYRLAVHPMINRFCTDLSSELNKSKPDRRTVLELRYHMIVPMIVSMTFPMDLTGIPVTEVRHD